MERSVGAQSARKSEAGAVDSGAGVRGLARRLPIAPGARYRRALRPVDRSDLVRIGTDYGGWTIPDGLIEPSWICYSAGVGNDISFDLGLIERYGCAVHAFDPTPTAAELLDTTPVDPQKFIFHPWGLLDHDSELRLYPLGDGESNFSLVNRNNASSFVTVPCRSLTSTMRELGHDRIDLLKLDIEGAEFGVLDSVTDGTVTPTLMCVEFHKRHAYATGPILRAIRRLRRRGYTAVSFKHWDVTFLRAGR
jgi:FkbM family methyltransferase